MNYEELVKALRIHASVDIECYECAYYDDCCINGNGHTKMMTDAAGAIEALQAQLPKLGQYVHGRELSREYVGDCLVSIDYEDWRCSVCGIVFEQWSMPTYNYCPNCGAKMEVQDDKA